MKTVDYIKKYPIKTFSRGEMLLQKGDPLTSLLAVRDGYVKVTSISESGIEHLLWIAGRYDVAPTEQLFSLRGKVNYFYTALTDGSYYEIPKEDFLTLAKNEPPVMTEIARNMSLHYDDFLQRIDAVDTATVKERLIRTLSYLAERLSADGDVDLYDYGLRLTHQDLAAMIGSTRETTSLTLAQLRKDGLIDYGRQRFTIAVDKVHAAYQS